MFCSLALAVIVLFVTYLLVVKPYRYWHERYVPSSPSWPILGHMAPFIFRKKPLLYCLQDFYSAGQGSRYHGIYRFHQPLLLIRNIDLIKQLTIKDFDSFVDRQILLSEKLDPLFMKSLVSLTGQRWKDMRSTLSPAFTSSKMRGMFILMRDCAEQYVNHIAKKTSAKESMEVEMKDIFTRFANDVIATCAFGIKCNSLKEKENEFYLKGKDALNFNGVRSFIFFGYAMFPWLMKFLSLRAFSIKISNFFRDLVMTNIALREKEGIVRMDMIHLLMEARKGSLKHEDLKVDQDAGFATVTESSVGKRHIATDLSDEDIAAQALLFFIAGFDVVSTVLCLMAYEMTLNPNVQKKLQAEVDATMKEYGGNITYDILLKMKYLDMVVSETLRKWPPSHILERVCVKPYTIEPMEPNEQPVHLIKNDNIVISIFGIHRDPQYYPDPEKFDPERFNNDNKMNILPFSYLPFGVGPRNCIGSRFALLEIKTIIFYLLSKFDLNVIEKTQIPLKLKNSQFTVDAENGYWLGLKLRSEVNNQ